MAGCVRLDRAKGADTRPGRDVVNRRDLDALVDDNEAKIAFNVKYLLDVLGVVEGSQVALEVATPSSPGVVRPIGTDNCAHVIMPISAFWDVRLARWKRAN